MQTAAHHLLDVPLSLGIEEPVKKRYISDEFRVVH